MKKKGKEIIILDEEEEKPLYYFIQVFPSDVLLSIEIRSNAKKKDEVAIQRSTLLEHISEELTSRAGEERGKFQPFPTDLEYQVRVVRDRGLNAYGKNVSLGNMVDLKTYPGYINNGLSTKLTGLLNDTSNTQQHVNVKIDNVIDNTIVIMVAPRSIAQRYYVQSISLPPTLDYEVSIFSGAPKELVQLINYHDRMDELNRIAEEKLPLVAPTNPDTFINPDNIVFVARKNGSVIGYCTCVLLRYREEVGLLLEQEIDALLEENANSLESYLMGVRPHHIYEIEGLSADPREKGKNIGYTLLYQALLFIHAPLIRGLYPVTHIGSQAASYITKRFLTLNFSFRYHGSNLFYNEHFVETMSDENKQSFMLGLREQISYYTELFTKTNTDRMRSWIRTTGSSYFKDEVGHVKKMFFNVIRLYQLFYLLLGTLTRCNPVTDAHIKETLGKFVNLFKNFVLFLPERDRRYSPLREYFQNNVQRIIEKGTDIGETVYTKKASTTSEVAFLKGEYSDYGFLYKGPPGSKKDIRREGYDLIYKTLPNMIALSEALGASKKVSYVLNSVNELVLRDLKRERDEPRDYDYEIPQQQLDDIRDAIGIIRQTNALSEQDENLALMSKLIFAQNECVTSNERFNKKFSTFIYEIPEAYTGLDTYISFELLDKKWTEIENRYLQRTNPCNLPTLLLPPKQASQNEMEIDVFGDYDDDCAIQAACNMMIDVSSPAIELLPESTDLASDIEALYNILVQMPKDNEIFVFKNYRYRASKLKEHLNNLVSMQSIVPIMVDGDDDDDINISIEEENREEMRPYLLEDFIDENLLEEEEEEYESFL